MPEYSRMSHFGYENARDGWFGTSRKTKSIGLENSYRFYENEVVLNDIIRRVYDVESDDARFRAFDGNKCIAGHFEGLRSNYPIRREFRFTRVKAENTSPTLKNKIAGLGFGIKS